MSQSWGASRTPQIKGQSELDVALVTDHPEMLVPPCIFNYLTEAMFCSKTPFHLFTTLNSFIMTTSITFQSPLQQTTYFSEVLSAQPQ